MTNFNSTISDYKKMLAKSANSNKINDKEISKASEFNYSSKEMTANAKHSVEEEK
jgi:hypothetical protein